MRKMAIAVAVTLLSTALYGAKPVVDNPLPAADDYTVLTGKVTLGTIDDHTVGVVIDQTGAFRHLFRLWTSNPVKPFRATSQSASIEYRGDELVIIAADTDSFWVLATSTGDARAPRQPAGFSATRYVGYGLNHEIRPLAAPQRNGKRTIIALDCDDFDSCIYNLDYDMGAGGGGSSDAGGVGSSSCSTSNNYGSCSVTCTTGYACCTAASGPNAQAYCRCKS